MHAPLRVFPRPLAVLALAASAVLLPARAGAQQGSATLTVVVTDSATGLGIPAAVVAVGGVRAQTNARGEATLQRLPAGPATVEVTRVGYTPGRASVELGAGAAATARVALSLDPVVLRRLRVTAEALPRRPHLRDFYIRKATWGSGYFLTRADFDRHRSAPFSDFLRRVPGAYIHHDDARGTTIRFDKSVASVVDRDCPPVFYLDGQLYQVGEDLDAEFQALRIEGVEVYTGARIPPQFGGSRARCGVVVIWTREQAQTVSKLSPAR